MFRDLKKLAPVECMKQSLIYQTTESRKSLLMADPVKSVQVSKLTLIRSRDILSSHFTSFKVCGGQKVDIDQVSVFLFLFRSSRTWLYGWFCLQTFNDSQRGKVNQITLLEGCSSTSWRHFVIVLAGRLRAWFRLNQCLPAMQSINQSACLFPFILISSLTYIVRF